MAIGLTPSDQSSEAAERRLRAAHHWFDTGDLTRAQDLIDQALQSLGPGTARSRALGLTAQIHFRRSSFVDAIRAAEAAGREPADPDLLVRLQLDVAFFSVSLGDLQGAARHAAAAFERMPPEPDPGLRAEVLAAVTITEFLSGQPFDEDRLARALELEDPTRRPAWQMRPSFIAGCLYLYAGRSDQAARIFTSMYEDAVERGEESGIPIHCLYLVWALVWHGDLGRARQVAEDAGVTASLLGDPASEAAAMTARALVHAHDGSHLQARDEAATALGIFQQLDWPTGTIFPAWALGLAQAAAGQPAAVDATLGPLAALVVGIGDIDPTMAVFLPDEIEALVALDRVDEARVLLDWLEGRAARLDRPVARAGAARCRALVDAADGDLDAAMAAVELALAEHDRIRYPFDRARSLLVGGRILRRMGRRAEARELLARSVGTFERLGAPVWAERAGAELDRLGRGRGSPDRLTPTEATVAEMAAGGLSNREIAEQAFLTVKAVEANLTRVYRKLGIRSRGGLARALAGVSETDHP